MGSVPKHLPFRWSSCLSGITQLGNSCTTQPSVIRNQKCAFLFFSFLQTNIDTNDCLLFQTASSTVLVMGFLVEFWLAVLYVTFLCYSSQCYVYLPFWLLKSFTTIVKCYEESTRVNVIFKSIISWYRKWWGIEGYVTKWATREEVVRWLQWHISTWKN